MESKILNPKSKIAGMGWVTPLGNDLDEVWHRLMNGERGEVKEITSPHSKRTHHCIPVPPKQVEAIGKNPRLRRSSAISYFTAAAGLAALENAGIRMTPEIAERTAVVFAVSSGGVIYTRKFHEQIVQQGAGAASPLLFPETVYNAPASHLSALLGVTGASYTLVGDSSVGLSALKLAEQLLDTTEIDRCLVVGGEEVDWILCEAYREWRFIGREVPLAEGAAAIVLAREGAVELHCIHDGVPFFRKSGAPAAIEKVLADLTAHGGADCIVCSANGSFIDTAERAAIEKFYANTPAHFPKQALGEALGASALMQTIYGALALKKQSLNKVIVSTLGFNQQAAGLVLAL
jgi:3-oxoacyl-(acyl-carrier-protein) synthase